MDFPVERWLRQDCAVFNKVADQHGGLSNMAGGFPIIVHDTAFRTSEALYQAMRFPTEPAIQQLIIEQKSPMAVKMVIKPFLDQTRPDWSDVRVLVMAWVVRMKLDQNLRSFGAVLDLTHEQPIVEQSHKDDFWGALNHGAYLTGRNVLGRLLSDLRIAREGQPKPPLDDMLLLGQRIT